MSNNLLGLDAILGACLRKQAFIKTRGTRHITHLNPGVIREFSRI
jgi:hypothetical protein